MKQNELARVAPLDIFFKLLAKMHFVQQRKEISAALGLDFLQRKQRFFLVRHSAWFA